jgi:hypothetical protein
MVQSSLRGPDELQEPLSVDGLVEKKACPGCKSLGHSARSQVIAQQDNRRRSVGSPSAHLARKFDAIRRSHVQVEKHHVKLAFFQETRGLSTSCQCQSIDAGGVQYSLNQFARCWFIVNH